MSATELELLARAHALFAGRPDGRPLPGAACPFPAPGDQTGAMAAVYRDAVSARLAALASALDVDAEFARVLTAAHRDHQEANRATAAVLAAARSDATAVPANPIAARELLRRRAARLRAQRSHVRAAHGRSRRRRADLQALRYRTGSGGIAGGGARARAAVEAALSRLGRPYVWGATGPDRFDCSGLVQWAYGQAGVRLHRTTYQQIHDGIPVAPSQVRPGDLVFPHTGHVQMAIGGNLVVEAPQPGATVRISRLGPSVAIRRPI